MSENDNWLEEIVITDESITLNRKDSIYKTGKPVVRMVDW